MCIYYFTLRDATVFFKYNKGSLDMKNRIMTLTSSIFLVAETTIGALAMGMSQAATGSRMFPFILI